jgi:hypothetical protein
MTGSRSAVCARTVATLGAHRPWPQCSAARPAGTRGRRTVHRTGAARRRRRSRRASPRLSRRLHGRHGRSWRTESASRSESPTQVRRSTAVQGIPRKELTESGSPPASLRAQRLCGAAAPVKLERVRSFSAEAALVPPRSVLAIVAGRARPPRVTRLGNAWLASDPEVQVGFSSQRLGWAAVTPRIPRGAEAQAQDRSKRRR